MPRKYNIILQQYADAKSVTMDPACNSFTVVNKGTSNVLFNGVPLTPQEAIEIKGDPDECFDGRVDLAFDGTGVVAPVNRAIVIQKINF